MIGPPTYPDHPIPTWEEFCDDYKAYFFDGSAPELGCCYVILVGGEPVGQVNNNGIEETRELWGPSDDCDSVYMVKTIP